MRVLLVQRIVSPFQLELARAFSSRAGSSMTVAFAESGVGARGRHWDVMADSTLAALATVRSPAAESTGTLDDWLAGTIERARPTVVLCGLVRGPVQAAAQRAARHRRVPFGYWLEPPNPRRALPVRMARWIDYRRKLGAADFVLAIGDRAETCYRRHNRAVALVPYGQDLSPCFAKSEPTTHGRARFVFSGQLIPRHNIPVLLNAIRILELQRPSQFVFTFAATGPLRPLIDDAVRATPALHGVIQVRESFGSWEERIDPLVGATAMVYPSAHSGWGLVIPEAMACGVPVVTTSSVEAARYFVRSGYNGEIVEPTAPAVFRAMQRAIDDRARFVQLGTQARVDARRGDAPIVAELLLSAIDALVPGADDAGSAATT